MKHVLPRNPRVQGYMHMYMRICRWNAGK